MDRSAFPSSQAEPGDRERADAWSYLTSLYQTYLADRKKRIAYSGACFAALGALVLRFIGKSEALSEILPPGFGLMFLLGMLALGLVAAGLAWMIFEAPWLRRIFVAIGCLLLVSSLIACALAIGVFPGSVQYYVDANLAGLTGLGLSVAAMVLIIPAGMTLLTPVSPPTEDAVETRLLLLTAQRAKAAEKAITTETSRAGRMRRRRR